MNWSWATSLDLISNSPAFPMWLTGGVAGFFAIIVLISLLRADRSAANGALSVIALLAIGIAVAATLRSPGLGAKLLAAEEPASAAPAGVALPALSCIDDLAGDAVLTACEKALFGSAESVAAAVSYAAAQINRLTELGDAAIADKSMTPQLQRLRRAVERDRYGLIAQVLTTRDHCKPTACAAFRALTDSHQIVSNMDERLYDGMVTRYAPSWNLPVAPTTIPAPAPVAALAPGVPTGRPTNAEFPTAASTPAVSIMTAEPVASSPPARAQQPPPAENARLLSPRPTASVAPALAAAKKPATPKPAPRTAAIKPAPAAAAPGSPAAAAPAPGASAAATDSE